MHRTVVVSFLFMALVILKICKAQDESSCPEPFKNQIEDKVLNKCFYIAGQSDSYVAAPLVCSGFGGIVFTVNSAEDFAELYKIYKSGSYYYLWLGAEANASSPGSFYWQNGEPVSEDLWCRGHPKGDEDYLCTYYSGTPLFGNKNCMYSGRCHARFFRHGIVCENYR